MHRQISHTDKPFYQETNLSLYLLTGLIGLLIGLDLWPVFIHWTGLNLPTWPNEFQPGFRLALLAAILGGARVLYTSIQGLLEGKVGADLALAIACVAAIVFNRPLVAAEIVFIGMFGECLESFTFERTQRAIRRIVEVCPRRCWLLRDGQEVRVFTTELKVGDVVVVKPGARIPVDGVVQAGRSAVDASALTGESLPVDKGPGDEVFAGTLNQLGALTIEARRVAEQTVVGRVIELTSKALQEKAELERTADRLARYFLPVVLVLAGLTLLGGIVLNLHNGAGARRPLLDAIRLSLDPTLAVLVVACPCALILATPAAIIAALGRLAGTGILIKGGAALERLAQVRALAFDKTGTLTEGRLELGDIVPLGGATADDLLRAAASAEQPSEHPLAQVILKEAVARGLTLDTVAQFRAHPGAGIVATFGAENTLPTRIVVGTPRLLEEQSLALSPDAQGVLNRLDRAGQTVLLVARDGVVLGAIGARDRLRPEAAGVLAALRQDGITDMAFLTGDRTAAAKAIAAELGIPEVHAELLPHEKADFIAAWKRQHAGKPIESSSWLDRFLTGRTSAGIGMVGDGINDAPALASADVGLALGGTGTDVAADAGDVVFMGDPLRSLPLLVRLSRQTVRIIHQNIILFAFGVNAVGILLTAWLWPILLPVEWHSRAPVAAVIYHQLGSFAVLLNAMRLLWFERSNGRPAVRRARRHLDAIDRWMEHYLNLDEGLHWLSHHAKAAAVVVVSVVLAGYAASGFTRINPDEVGVVCRFGRPLPNDLEPGLSWHWPWPIETVIRARPDAVQTVEIGFRSLPGTSATPGGLGWSSGHDNVLAEPEEALMMTGDGNLVELQATVRYAIRRDRLRTYLFEVRNPAEVVRATAESVLRETMAGRPFLDLLTSARVQFQKDVLARLSRRCAELKPDGLGIRLEGFSVHDLHPPQEVQPAYYDVIKAMQDRDRQINEAQAEAKRTLSRAQARARQTVADAEARGATRVLQATSERERYLAWYAARHSLEAGEQWGFVRDLLMDVGRGTSWRQAYATAKKRYQQRVAMQALLTDFRLFWEAFGGALKDRQAVIVDADNVPGRRHLFLFDLSQLRLPALLQQQEKK